VNSRRVPPEPDELEVSVFGLRKGESIAVHVPDGPWFVIDSMTSGTGASRAPVAATYLRDYLDVNELYGVFLTHWHDDHTRGAADLMQAAVGKEA
jgi:glyoxylase-like metal-dependent hydrolase (beta-lactamase superfamily II)